MGEIEDKGNKKNIINLSRNSPVALVVGVGGFLGSNLADRLLEKNIQVIGVDNFITGKRENLVDATKKPNFHLFSEDAGGVEFDIDRLDYIFIVTSDGWDIKNVLRIFKSSQARLLFASYIELYSNKELDFHLEWFKKSEIDIAKFARENKLNARILRLGAIYGPRMHFRTKDPIVKLIQEALNNDLQKDVPLEFSTRALYIKEVIELIIKCNLSGATAQKIFDGVSPNPIKVSEIKQVLLDPVWYEERGFKPTELPPWHTPNLDRTIDFLNWKMNTDIVKSLKNTVSYFKDNEILIPESRDNLEVKESKPYWDEAKKDQVEGFKSLKKEETVTIGYKQGKGAKKEWSKAEFVLNKIFLVAVIGIIVYAFIWPIFAGAFGVWTFRYEMVAAIENLEKGEFEESLNNVAIANIGINETQKILESVELVRKITFINKAFENADYLFNLAFLTSDSAKNTVLGIQSLYKSLKAVTGENNDSPKDYFDSSKVYLAKADEDLSKAQALINSKSLSGYPGVFKSEIDNLSRKLSGYAALVKKGRAIVSILPEVVAVEGEKKYLILLQNNMELRPAGGFIGSFAKVSFAGGKLKKLEVNDIYNIDGQLQQRVEPPVEIKEDLGQKFWYLRDSNWEPDYPTAARQAEWFYNKETGERVEGTFALDVSAIEDLLSVLGPLDLADYGEKITSDNLFEKAVSHAEVSFFPGSQAKKSFLAALTNEIFSKLFFLPNQNWPKIVRSISKSLEQKHMSIYLDDPRLFSYLVSQNWVSVMPRQQVEKTDILQDFLAPVEANLGANKANFYIDRNYNLETVINKDGQVSQRLRIAYTNRSPSDTFPGGKYKDRIRFYLPFGSKLTRALWAESDVTKDTKTFVDYGRSGYSILLELKPKEQKTLILDYQLPESLMFKNGIAKYRLDVVKQAGTLKDPFTWQLSFPINYQLVFSQTQKPMLQEQTIQTDLSTDRSFEVEFKK